MRSSLRSALRALQQLVTTPASPPGTVPGPSSHHAGGRTGAYPGDATTPPDMTYTPRADGLPDPGEVVWAWVPYEEDHRQGKDRPALIIGRDGAWLVGLQLTSQDHDRDAEQERAAGRIWVDVGTGGWDSQGRPSEVRVNRLIRLDPGAVRREGAALPRDRFDAVAAAVRAAYA
jgi:hypothetical protein